MLPEYVSSAKQLISGYAAAQGQTRSGLGWQYLAGLLAFAIGLAGALQMTSDGPARRRWGIVALWVVFCFFEYKEAFVVHERYHGTIFFVALMGGFLAFRWRWRTPWVGLASLGMLCILAITAELWFFDGLDDPLERANSAITDIRQTISPAQSAAITGKGRRAIQHAYPIDPATLSELQGHTVHVAPYQTSVAWAYELDWHPLPAFQSYAAYTTTLDQDNANALNSGDAPERILRNIEENGIKRNLEEEPQHRVAAFDEGLATRATLCRYIELSRTRTWAGPGARPESLRASRAPDHRARCVAPEGARASAAQQPQLRLRPDRRRERRRHRTCRRGALQARAASRAASMASHTDS